MTFEEWEIANGLNGADDDQPTFTRHTLRAAYNAALAEANARIAWTEHKPEVEGWYWYRDMTLLQECVVWVASDDNELLVYFENCNDNVDDLTNCEWAGPIVPPTDNSED
jgi:hypothetical protein